MKAAAEVSMSGRPTRVAGLCIKFEPSLPMTRLGGYQALGERCSLVETGCCPQWTLVGHDAGLECPRLRA